MEGSQSTTEADAEPSDVIDREVDQGHVQLRILCKAV